jgi:hypothetical protein
MARFNPFGVGLLSHLPRVGDAPTLGCTITTLLGLVGLLFLFVLVFGTVRENIEVFRHLNETLGDQVKRETDAPKEGEKDDDDDEIDNDDRESRNVHRATLSFGWDMARASVTCAMRRGLTD